MKVSVITVARNAALQLPETFQSVQCQNGLEIEHVLVDGASTDGTLEVVAQYGKHLAKVVSEPDSGIYDAFNKGLNLVTGDVVVFLNAGDTYTDDRVLARMSAAIASANVDAAFADVQIVEPEARERTIRYYRSGFFNPGRLKYGFMPAHPALFIKRSIYKRLGGYDPTFAQAGDFEFCVRAFKVHAMSYVYVPEAIVRMPDGGVSNRGLKSKLVNTREMLRACAQNGLRTNYLTLSVRLPIKAVQSILMRN